MRKTKTFVLSIITIMLVLMSVSFVSAVWYDFIYKIFNKNLVAETYLLGNETNTTICSNVGNYYGCNNPPYTIAASCGSVGINYYNDKGYTNVSLKCCNQKSWGWDCYFEGVAPINQSNCTNDCSYSGQRSCNGNYIMDCGNYDNDSCLDWNKYYQYCTNGCLNGVCKINETLLSCTDSDNGINLEIKGYTTSSTGTKYYDRCSSNSNYIVEQYCQKGLNSILIPSEKYLACPTGKTCQDGACIQNQTNTTCTNDCSYSGQKTCSGTYVKNCGNYDADSCLEWNSGTYCSYGCLNGTCTQTNETNQTTPGNYTCTDTDNGINYNTKGTVTVRENSAVIGGGTDYCISYGVKKGKLRELYCQGNSWNSTDYSCPNGCKNGACI